MINRNSVNKLAELTNYAMKLTYPELVKAYKYGYKIFVLDGLVSENVGNPFKKYIGTLYEK